MRNYQKEEQYYHKTECGNLKTSNSSKNNNNNNKVHASTDDNCSTLEEKEGEVDGWITWERMRNYQKEGSSITITKRNFKQRAKGWKFEKY